MAQAQLNNALQNLVYVPDVDYKYEGSNPENLHIDLIDGDGTPNTGAFVEIRVLKPNLPPVFTDTLADQSNLQPEIEHIFTDALEVDDLDNNDNIDGDDPADPDGNDGAENELLLVGALECGDPVLAGTGFHFGSSVIQADDPTVDDLLETYYNVGGDAAAQPIADAIIAALDAVAPGLVSTPLATSNPFDYTTAFAGISDIQEIRDALDTIYFKHSGGADSCTLTVVVSDLGNNGLPFQYTGSPPTGKEIPLPYAIADTITLSTAELDTVDVSLDSGTLFVLEGTDVEVPLSVDPTSHPAFPVQYSFVGGTAVANDDFQSITDDVINIEADDATVDANDADYIQFNAYNDNDVEPLKTLTVEIEAPTLPPPAAFARPVGWEVTTNTSTRTIVIVDDDAPRSLLSVSSATVNEGNIGDTTTMTFTLTLDGPATGSESIDIATVSDSATGGTDYVTASETISFALGATTATFEVEVTGDGLVEPTESFDLQIDNAVGMDISSTTVGTGTITNDDVPLTVTIAQAPGQLDPSGDLQLDFRVTFNKPVGATFSASDVTVDPGTTGADTTATVTGGPSVFNVAVDGMTAPGVVAISVPAGAATDAGGNLSEAPTIVDDDITFEIDNVAPTLLLSQAVGQNDPTTASPIQFTAQFSEPVTGFTAGDVQLSATTGAGTTVAVSAVDADTYTVNVTGMTQSGNVSVAVPDGAAQDGANNPSETSPAGDTSVDFVFDDTDPTVSVEQKSDQADPTSASPVRFTATFSEPVFELLASEVTLSAGTSGATVVSIVSVSTTVYTIEIAGMTADGSISVSIPAGVADDAAGNSNVASTSVDNVVLFELPDALSIVVPADVTVNAAPGLATAVVNYAAPTALGGVPPTSASCVPASGSTFPLGANLVTCTATDGTAATASGTFTVTVNDNQPPTVSVPDTSVVSAGALAVVFTPSAADNSGVVNVVCVPSSGSVFPIGATTVTCTATDPSNNTATDTGTVTVSEPPPNAPQLQNVPSNIVVSNAPGQGGAIVTFAKPTVTGGVPPVTVTCTKESGDFFVIGTTTVTCTATDSAQQMQQSQQSSEAAIEVSVSASFNVTVNDVDKPTITLPPINVFGTSPMAVTYTPSVSDNSGGSVTVQCVPPSGSVFAVGTTIITCTATDGSGNSVSASGSVTITDMTDEEIPATGSGLPQRLVMIATALMVVGALLRRRAAIGVSA
jgi:large repetitive protein